jgi:RNA-directed DNA polymerase
MTSPFTQRALEMLARRLAVDAGDLARVAARAGAMYTLRRKHKANGMVRVLHVPSRELRSMQRRLLTRVLDPLPVSRHAFGFVRGRSVAAAAQRHVGQQCVIRLDVRDFFPSITRTMVERALSDDEVPPEAAALIARLVTFRGRLPQGAPTSPAASNLVFRPLDRRLAALARRRGLRYTRYADDLTFSGGGGAPKIISPVSALLREHGFRLHEEKTRIQRRGAAQRVLGLVVNDRLGVPRMIRRRLRAALHRAACAEGGASESRLAQLAGEVAYVAGISPSQAQRLRPMPGQVRVKREKPLVRREGNG